MLVANQVPREYREYAKLLRRIGLGDGWPDARSRVDEANPYVMRYVNYFDRLLSDRVESIGRLRRRGSRGHDSPGKA